MQGVTKMFFLLFFFIVTSKQSCTKITSVYHCMKIILKGI